MTWIDKILPILGVALGWLLSQYGKYSSDKKNDKRKLKRLLYNLLELRWFLNIDLNIEKDINKFLAHTKERFSSEFSGNEDEIENGLNKIKPILMEQLKTKLIDFNRIKEIELNINNTLVELSEIYPVFAYQLDGQYKIRERVDKTNNYIKQFEKYFTKMDFELQKKMQPKLADNFLSTLDYSIVKISKKIGRKTKKDVLEILKERNPEEDDNLQSFLDEYFKQKKNNG